MVCALRKRKNVLSDRNLKMMEKEMVGPSIVIKNFSADREVSSVDELKRVLAKEYRGKSISVVHRKRSGMKAVTFVCVNKDGNMIETYGNRKPVDFEKIAADIST